MGSRPVLVVDDDPDTRLLIARVLMTEGYPVEMAGDGRDGLTRLASCRPFVVLLDLDMPVMDGRAFRLSQRQLSPELSMIPVILCSASNALDEVAAELQPFACLPKPLPSLDPLLDQVAAAQLAA